jgi:hypothetical protein
LGAQIGGQHAVGRAEPAQKQNIASLVPQQFFQSRFVEGIGIGFDDHRIIGFDEHRLREFEGLAARLGPGRGMGLIDADDRKSFVMKPADGAVDKTGRGQTCTLIQSANRQFTLWAEVQV